MDPTEEGSPKLRSSYPPPFLRERPSDQEAASCQEGFESDHQIPLIDLQKLDGEQLDAACREWGIFRLVNHGIPQELTERLLRSARTLFSRPFEAKHSEFRSPVTYFWGSPAIQRVQKLNWLEGFHVPLAGLREQTVGCGDGAGNDDLNVVLSRFRSELEEYGRHVGRVARGLFEAMGERLHLPAAARRSYLSEPEGFLRVYHYPRCPTNRRGLLGMEPHTDSSVLSVLNQDGAGGLQVLKGGRWVDVSPDAAGALVVNIGDMMQAMSGDEYRSAEHRVTVKESGERFSICYFVFPEDDEVIGSSGYRPFTYREFRERVQEDIKATGSKVGLQRFKRNE